MPNEFLRDCLPRLVRRENLNSAEAALLLDGLLAADSTDGQIAAILIALATKGETISELAGLANALRARALRIACKNDCFIDTAGTGSSPAKTFNISTAAAFVIAGAGLPVAKHGNRAASSRSGSADVLTALGVNVSATPQISEECFARLGICFMFAPLYHAATARVAAVRRELGIQTTFNLLGPLSNPARAPRQIIGVWRKDLMPLMAGALAELGTTRAWVVHAADGLDEITIQDRTFVTEVSEGIISNFEVKPEDFGLPSRPIEHLRGGNVDSNAQVVREVLRGSRRDEARSLVLINAAAALFVGGQSATLAGALGLAEDSIDSGAAASKLDQLILATNS